MRILQLLPIWEPVPPPAYGGIEVVVDDLTRGIAKQGHEVIITCSRDSPIIEDCDQNIQWIPTYFDSLRRKPFSPYDKQKMVREHLSYVMEVARSLDLDLIHNHASEEGIYAIANCSVPVLTTVHYPPYDYEKSGWLSYRGYYNTISYSEAENIPPEAGGISVGTVHNAIDIDTFPFVAQGDKKDYILFMGRFSPDKGAHIACKAAKQAGVPLILAGKIDRDWPVDVEYFENAVWPHIDGKRISYFGEANAQEKRDLFKYAKATIVPIMWNEPFGLVMIESLACGTPVIAFRRGAAPEIVRDGETGFLIEPQDILGMSGAIHKISEIDSLRCRDDATERFDVSVMVGGYLSAYEKILVDYKSRSF